MAQTITIPVPVEIPGEDVANPPHPPVTARRPLPQVAWPDARPEWSDLCTAERLVELRRGDQSEYFDDFAEDPTTWADCPIDGRVVVMAEGICDQCGREVPAMRGLAA